MGALGWKSARATVVGEEEVTGEALLPAVQGSRTEVSVGSRKALPVSPDRDAAGEGTFNIVVIGAGSASFAGADQSGGVDRHTRNTPLEVSHAT